MTVLEQIKEKMVAANISDTYSKLKKLAPLAEVENEIKVTNGREYRCNPYVLILVQGNNRQVYILQPSFVFKRIEIMENGLNDQTAGMQLIGN